MQSQHGGAMIEPAAVVGLQCAHCPEPTLDISHNHTEKL